VTTGSIQAREPVPPALAERLAGRTLWLSGGRGFIGSAVAALAAAAGARVVGFTGDVRDADAVRRSVLETGPSLLIHLAARVDVSRDPALMPVMDAVIRQGSAHVRAAARELGDAQLVQVGTCEEYGTIPAPFGEEDEPSEPVSPYAAAKLAATRDALAEVDGDGLRVVVARPFLTYGPGQRPRQLIPALIKAVLAGRPFPMTAGRQTREVNYVDDVALGLLRAVTTVEAHGHVVNIGGGEELAVRDLAARVVRACGAEPGAVLQIGALPTRPGEVPRFWADVRKAEVLLGHRPAVSLDEGLRRTVDAMRRGMSSPMEDDADAAQR